MRMLVEKEEVPSFTINFVSKTGNHTQFYSWSDTILGRPGMKVTLIGLGIIRAITQARKMIVDWKPTDLEFFYVKVERRNSHF